MVQFIPGFGKMDLQSIGFPTESDSFVEVDHRQAGKVGDSVYGFEDVKSGDWQIAADRINHKHQHTNKQTNIFQVLS
jgi:hypothetical protein